MKKNIKWYHSKYRAAAHKTAIIRHMCLMQLWMIQEKE